MNQEMIKAECQEDHARRTRTGRNQEKPEADSFVPGVPSGGWWVVCAFQGDPALKMLLRTRAQTEPSKQLTPEVANLGDRRCKGISRRPCKSDPRAHKPTGS